MLLYVSLYEHVIKVFDDHDVATLLSATALDEIYALVVNGLKHRKPATGLQAAAKKTNELLPAKTPMAKFDTNELAHYLVLID